MIKTIETEVAIVGSGMGGGMLARALAERGIDVLVAERGHRLPREEQNWDPHSVFRKNRYKNAGLWKDGSNNKNFKPGVHYYVGGNTKVYGASLIRFREKDFDEYQAAEGISPAWPFSYQDLEPYYLAAEKALRVRGSAGADPTEPPRSGDYPYPALDHDPYVEGFAKSLRNQGLHPYQMSMGVDFGFGGKCIRCKTCDGFPCQLGAKNDSETCGIDPALATGKAHLLEGVTINRLVHDAGGKKIIKAIGSIGEEQVEIVAKTFVISGGAANSAALLLRSKSDKHPTGLSNSSGLVGRNWMVHNATFMVGMNPGKKNASVFQKTLAFNDWYFESQAGYPLGNVQMLGKLQADMFKDSKPWIPTGVLRAFASRSIDIYLESEDLPDKDNQVLVDDRGNITINWKPNNLAAHRQLIKQAQASLRRAGFPFVLKQTMGIETNSHMCGTLVAGRDPQNSVLDEYCRSHDMENLFVVDSSFFPSSGAANPALTIAAQAYRVAAEGDVLR